MRNNFKELNKRLDEREEEIERLKRDKEWWKDRFFGQQEYDDSHRITAIEYSKRIDKAIEYIKKVSNNGMFELRMEEIEELLDILKGEDNDR